MELIVVLIAGILIGAGSSILLTQRINKKIKTNEWVNWKPVDERMETPTGIKGRATHNKIANDNIEVEKPKKRRNPRKNTTKRKYYKKNNTNKQKKVTQS